MVGYLCSMISIRNSTNILLIGNATTAGDKIYEIQDGRDQPNLGERGG